MLYLHFLWRTKSTVVSDVLASSLSLISQTRKLLCDDRRFLLSIFCFLHFVLQPLLACITDTVGTVVIVLGLLFILLFSSSVSNDSCYNSCDLLPYVIFVMFSTSSEGEFFFFERGVPGYCEIWPPLLLTGYHVTYYPLFRTRLMNAHYFDLFLLFIFF